MATKQLKETNPESIHYDGYIEFLDQLKSRVLEARLDAAQSVNRQLVRLYWEIGVSILEKQEQSDWGEGFLQLLSQDLQRTLPGTKGFSVTNLKYMRLFAKAYPEINSQPVIQIPWGHNKVLLGRLDDHEHRVWYARKTLEHGWSRSILEMYIDNNLYGREGKAISNFRETLPAPQSDLAQQVTRDPYSFDFLTLRKDYIEKELEGGLTEHVCKMLMALGNGFSFMGNQYPITVDGIDFFMDMLFFHVKLNCFVVVELKATEFKPEYTGKLNFYLSAVDDLIRGPNHEPTIGLLLCKDKKGKAVVEYSLRGMSQPMSVSSYTTSITDHLPEDLEASLPSQEELAARLDHDFS